MTDRLTAYRDDGPLTRLAVDRVRLPVSELPLTIGATAALVAGFAADGTTTGTPSVVGVTTLLLAGGLAGAARHRSRAGWLVPPLLRAGEYGAIAVLAHRAGQPAQTLAYVLLAVVAFHHYDIVYRLRHQGIAPPRIITALGAGWEGRTLLVLVATLMDVLTQTLAGLAVWCCLLFLSESLRSWSMFARDATGRSAVGLDAGEGAI